MKDEMTGAQVVADMEICIEESQNDASNVAGSNAGAVSGQGGLIGLIASAFIIGAYEGWQRSEAKKVIFNRCMKSKGYSATVVPKSLLKEYRSADSHEERAAVIDKYLASPDYLESQDWLAAQNERSVESYEEFLLKYPESERHNEAAANLEKTRRTRDQIEHFAKYSHWEKPEFKLHGLTGNGWVETTVGDTHACNHRGKGDIRLVVKDGWIQGRLLVEGNTIPVALFGRLDANGAVELRSGWPLNEPLIISGGFDRTLDLITILSGIEGARCEQAIWFKPPDHLPETESDSDADAEYWLGAPLLSVEEVEARFMNLPAKIILPIEVSQAE